MSITTTHPTEAELEARINATLARVFPMVTALKHQLRFKLRVGRTELEAGVADYVEGRADIIIYQGDAALAVLELKREGLRLTQDDDEQGRSYALLVQAPIVVVTNGVETKIYQTHNMELLAGTSIDATEIARRFEAAANSARAGTAEAISKLLGSDLAAPTVAAMTAAELNEITGDWGDGERFVRDFLVPRQATKELKAALREEKRKVIFISGPPLSGKSSVLREFTLDSAHELWDVLFIDASSCNEGLFRRLANALATNFSWPASEDDSRVWLRKLSVRSDRMLVLCLDSLPVSTKKLLGELDELLSSFGDQLRIVIAIDENDVDQLRRKSNGREFTRIGRKSFVVTVGNYDDEEFALARNELGKRRGHLVHGAKYANELRSPWVLRAIAAMSLQDLPAGKVAVLPPILGVETFFIADERFACLGDLRDDFKRLASVYLEDRNASRNHGDVLTAMHLFSIRKEVVKDRLDRESIREMLKAGLIRRGKACSGDAIYVVCTPELFGYEIALRISNQLRKRIIKGADEAAGWLVSTCSKMPLGDAIGAHAISLALHDMGAKRHIDLVNALLKKPPRRERLVAGSRWVTLLPDVGLFDVEFCTDGTMTMNLRGSGAAPLQVEFDEDDIPSTTSCMDGWLILSQMREFRLLLVDVQEHSQNIAANLLLQLGTCPSILRRPSRNLEEFHTHEIEGGEISCFKNGIAEPVTWAISELLSNDIPGVDRDAWVQAAAASGSAPLVNRLGQALTHIADLQHLGDWAKEMLETHYKPALAAHLKCH